MFEGCLDDVKKTKSMKPYLKWSKRIVGYQINKNDDYEFQELYRDLRAYSIIEKSECAKALAFLCLKEIVKAVITRQRARMSDEVRWLIRNELEDLAMEVLTYHISRENNRLEKNNAKTLEEIKHSISRAVFEDVRFSFMAVWHQYKFRENYIAWDDNKFVNYLNNFISEGLNIDVENELTIWRNYYNED